MRDTLPVRALITGATSGIGKATASAFIQAGIDLVVIGRSPAKLSEIAAEGQTAQVDVQPFAIDLALVEEVQDRIRTIVETVGPIDVLVNSAGMGYTNPLTATSLADWQQVINLNLTSVFQCIQAVLPTMRQQQRGTIINVSSIAAYNAFPDWGAYSVSKAGLVALSKTLAVEERTHGIRVVTVSPGAVNTALWDTDTVQADFDRSQMLTPETVAQSILHTALLPPQAVIEALTVLPSAGAL